MKADPLDEIERALRKAIRERRIVVFTHGGCRRLAEPHDYGIKDGKRRLFYRQVSGESRSGNPYGWRWAERSGISDLHVLDRRFPGPRPAPSGRHIRWDDLFASVSERDRKR